MPLARTIPLLLLASCVSLPPEAWTTTTASGTSKTSVAPPWAAGPVDIDDAAVFAVAHNPGLVALRAAIDVSDAEVMAAALLPDPDASLGVVVPIGGSGEGVGVDGGIHWQLSSLWTRDSAIDAASADRDAARFRWGWQEQAVVADVRLQASRVVAADARAVIVAAAVDSAAVLVDEARAAVDRGDVTLAVLTLRATTLQQARSHVVDVDRDRDAARRALCADLGLAPGCDARLKPRAPTPTSLPPLAALVATAEACRLDLRALRPAWESNEAQLRGAVLAQFPAVGLAINGGKDTGGFAFGGATVDVTLPVFDGGQGARAIGTATRARLRSELESRHFDVRRDLADAIAVVDLARRERALLLDGAAGLERGEAVLADARAGGDVTSAAWSEARSQLLETRLRLVDLDAAEREAFIALEAATGVADPRPARRP